MRALVLVCLLAACVETGVPEGEAGRDADAAELRSDAVANDAAPDARPPDAGADAGFTDASALDAGPPADAGLEEGSFAAPFVIRALPYRYAGDTRGWPHAEASRYSCAPNLAEDGPEVVFTWTPSADGILEVRVDDTPGDEVDLDVHVLDAPRPDRCLARANVVVRQTVRAGAAVWIAADTWHDGGRALAGPFVLEVSFAATSTGTCPADMSAIEGFCMDRHEAPNRLNAAPLVMFDLYESEAWCAARGKRLCFDDEWTLACATAAGLAYPYGPTRRPGVCNDDRTWRAYDQALLSAWPRGLSTPNVEDVNALFDAAARTARATADHLRWLYQGEAAGENPGCTNGLGAFDLVGNVEEWTRRRDGGEGRDFSGNLKGRYWAESRTCQSGVRTHGNAFRFYEIGFRCCRDR